MAEVSGEVVEIGTRDALFDPVNSTIIIKSGRKIVATGTVDRDNRFSIEIPDDLRGAAGAGHVDHRRRPGPVRRR